MLKRLIQFVTILREAGRLIYRVNNEVARSRAVFSRIDARIELHSQRFEKLMDDYERLMSRMERVCEVVNSQQQQVRILHDDMSTMIRGFDHLQQYASTNHHDLGVISNFLVEQYKKQPKALDKPNGA